MERKVFNKAILKSLNSNTYKKSCEEVNGIDLCQLNMVDKEQLDKLLEVLNLKEEDRVLDLGCGAGVIGEYVASQTGANITGVDFSPKVIKLTSRPLLFPIAN